MTAMIAARLYEIKIGRQVLAVRARCWAEKQARQGMHVARTVAQVAATKHFWTGLSSFVCQKFVDKIWHHPHIRNVAKRATDVVRGKKEIKSTGPVSFYLKDVSDYKKHVRSK